jgi:hypothetical protein
VGAILFDPFSIPPAPLFLSKKLRLSLSQKIVSLNFCLYLVGTISEEGTFL